MKRFWLGVGLLAALLALGLLTALSMERIHRPISDALDLAASAAAEENWEQARIHYTAARERWTQYRSATAAVADHTPMEQVDALFAQLEIFLQKRETLHFAAVCRELGVLTAAVGEAHGLSWRNIL